MKIAYTVFYSKELDNDKINRLKNVESIKNFFGSRYSYIDSETFVVKSLKDYKLIIKKEPLVAGYKFLGKFRLGAIGLLLTTIMFYKKVLEMDYDIFLIFEDDAEINFENIDNLEKYLESLPESFDVFSMHDSPFFFKEYNSSDHEIGAEDICLTYNRMSTMAYAISKKGIKKYLNFMSLVIDNPIDFFLFDKDKDTEQYSIKPSSPQLFLSNNFNEVGEPLYYFSSINKTEEIEFL